MTQFNIAISNCNSVDRAEVVLTKGTLNIKYEPNGLGKRTLAKAIVSKIRGDGGLQDLVPFKHRGNVEAAPPGAAITPLKIDLALMDKMDSEDTRSITDPVNAQLESLLSKVSELTGQVKKHKSKIKKTIESNQNEAGAP